MDQVGSTSAKPKTIGLPVPCTQRVLAGWLRADHFAMYPAQGNTPAEITWHQAKHAHAVQSVSQLPTVELGPTPAIEITDASENEWVSEIKKGVDFLKYYSHLNPIVGYVPINEITVFQPHLRSHHESAPQTQLDILKWCLPSTFAAHVSIRTEGNRILLLGNDPTFQILPPQSDPNGRGILIPIGANANWVQVKRVSGRYILHNGHHRVASLAAAGHTLVPAIVSDAPDLEHVIPLQANRQYRPWWTPQELLGFPRPPRVIDFFDPKVTMDLPAEQLMRVVEIRMDVQQFQLPVELK